MLKWHWCNLHSHYMFILNKYTLTVGNNFFIFFKFVHLFQRVNCVHCNLIFTKRSKLIRCSFIFFFLLNFLHPTFINHYTELDSSILSEVRGPASNVCVFTIIFAITRIHILLYCEVKISLFKYDSFTS